MKVKLLFLIGAFWCFFIGVALSQSSLYFYYDQACVQKMDYERMGIFHDIAYTDYYINISENKKAVFRVLKDNNYLNRELVNEIPDKPFMCIDRDKISDELINAINQSTKVAYIVVAFGKQYAMYEVRTVSTYFENQGVVRYNDEKYSFECNTNTVKNGDLLNPTSNKDRNIFFELSGKQNCYKLHTLKAVSQHTEDAITYVSVMDGLGIYKIYTEAGEMHLKSINDIPTNDAIQQMCTGGKLAVVPTPIPKTTPIPKVTAIPTTNEDTVGMSAIDKALWESKQKTKGTVITGGGTTIGTNSGSSTLGTTQTIGANDTLEGGYYLVQSQESLYVISEKFGIPIRRIMEINNLNSYALGLGQRLKVVDDGTVPMRNRSPLIKTDSLAKTKTFIHIVEQGETLYSISVQYGLKLPELYKLNKQLQNEFIDIDQQLVVGVQPL